MIITITSKIKFFNEYFCFLSLTRSLLLTRHQKYPGFHQQFCPQKCFRALVGVMISCFPSPFSWNSNEYNCLDDMPIQVLSSSWRYVWKPTTDTGIDSCLNVLYVDNCTDQLISFSNAILTPRLVSSVTTHLETDSSKEEALLLFLCLSLSVSSHL